MNTKKQNELTKSVTTNPKKSPSDIEIIGVLMAAFKMTHFEVVDRLKEFDSGVV